MGAACSSLSPCCGPQDGELELRLRSAPLIQPKHVVQGKNESARLPLASPDAKPPQMANPWLQSVRRFQDLSLFGGSPCPGNQGAEIGPFGWVTRSATSQKTACLNISFWHKCTLLLVQGACKAEMMRELLMIKPAVPYTANSQ